MTRHFHLFFRCRRRPAAASTRFALLALIGAALTGCGMLPAFDEVLPDKRTEYRKSKSLPDLEVPPDLSTEAIRDRMAIPTGGEVATYSTYQERVAASKRERELEVAAESAIQVLENEHVLAVEGAKVQVWPKLREFFENLGYDAELDDEELGVFETTWYENEAELVRDKFKVFAEAGQKAGTSVLYVSHRGEELVPEGGRLVWQPRPRDARLEKRLVERLQETLTGIPVARTASAAPGTDYAPAGAGGRAEVISAGGGKVYLSVREEFSDAWRSTADALARSGIEIKREDRTKGVYYIPLDTSASEDKGMFSRLKFWGGDGDNHQLTLTGVGDKTEVVVLDSEGRWETAPAAADLLARLSQVLNSTTIR